MKKVRQRKTNINRWDLIKLTSFCTAKETINKTKRQPADWEKIFANDVTNKNFISKYTNSLYNSTTENEYPDQKIGRPKYTFFKEDIQMASR